MQENNKELKHKDSEVKLTKKNYIIIIIPILLIVILTIAIATYVFVFNSEEAKLKKYLTEHQYICNNESCSISVNNDTETIDYKTGVLTVTNTDYTYMINQNYISYQDNIKELVCTYRGSNYSFYNKIDNTFTIDTNCEVYIKNINKTIEKYQEIFTFAGIDVNQLKK